MQFHFAYVSIRPCHRGDRGVAAGGRRRDKGGISINSAKKGKQMKLASTLAVAGMLAASGAWAFDWSDMYVGVDVGRSKVAMSDSVIGPPAAATAHNLSKSDSDGAYKIFAGSQVMDYLAVEGGYADFGRFSATRTITAPVGIAGTGTSGGKTSGVYADAIISYPVGAGVSVLGKLGYGYYWTRVSNTVTGAPTFPAGTPASDSVIGKGFQFGLGAQVDIGKHVAIRGGWQRMPNVYAIGAEKLSIDVTSLGLIYKF